MPLRPCLDCGALSDQGRCPTHRAVRERARTRAKRAVRPYTGAESRRRSSTVAAWRALHGDWCPGWQCPPHPAHDLTADHIVAVASGGDEKGELSVLCRSCNSRKAANSAVF